MIDAYDRILARSRWMLAFDTHIMTLARHAVDPSSPYANLAADDPNPERAAEQTLINLAQFFLEERERDRRAHEAELGVPS